MQKDWLKDIGFILALQNGKTARTVILWILMTIILKYGVMAAIVIWKLYSPYGIERRLNAALKKSLEREGTPPLTMQRLRRLRLSLMAHWLNILRRIIRMTLHTGQALWVKMSPVFRVMSKLGLWNPLNTIRLHKKWSHFCHNFRHRKT